jgi:probable rRNA maturation factor
MPRATVDIHVFPAFAQVVSRTMVRKAVQEALKVGVEGKQKIITCNVSVVIADDETVKNLNARYRGLNETTDVLSFSNVREGQWEGDENAKPRFKETSSFVFPEDGAAPLGEVIISYPQTQRQATAKGVLAERELATLVIHGVLHLLGYDHVEEDEARELEARQRLALSQVI